MPVSVEKTSFLPESQDSSQVDQFIDEMSDEIDAFMPGKPVDSADNEALSEEDFANGGYYENSDYYDEQYQQTRELSHLYRVTTKQGDGGCSVVYDAWRIADGAHVALKVLALSPTLAPEDAERARERFFTEAQVLTSFMDDHIVKCLNYGLYCGAPCVVLEFISGKQLDNYIRDYGMLPYEYAIGIIRQILLALEEAHNKGIIHRDLKPANILVVREVEPPVVKLIDFGIATITERADASLSRTPNGIIRGTPAYMAPELFSGDKTATIETDLYAIGLILLECLTGNVAYAAPSLMQVAYKQVNEDLSIPAFIPECLSHIISKCCEKDPANRYHSARDLIFDLDNALPMALAQKDKCEQDYLKSIEVPAPKLEKKHSGSLPVIIALIACLIAAGTAIIVVLNMPKDPDPQFVPENLPPAAAAPTEPAPIAAPAPAPAPVEPPPVVPEPVEPPVVAPVEPTPVEPVAAPAPAEPEKAAEPEKPSAPKANKSKSQQKPKNTQQNPDPAPKPKPSKKSETYVPTSMF